MTVSISLPPASPEVIRRPQADSGDDPRRGREDRSHSGHSGQRKDPDAAPEFGREVDRPFGQGQQQVSFHCSVKKKKRVKYEV